MGRGHHGIITKFFWHFSAERLLVGQVAAKPPAVPVCPGLGSRDAVKRNEETVPDMAMHSSWHDIL